MKVENIKKAIQMAEKASDILVEEDTKDYRIEEAMDSLDDAINELKECEKPSQDGESFAEKLKEVLLCLCRAYDAVGMMDIDQDSEYKPYTMAWDAVDGALIALLQGEEFENDREGLSGYAGRA